MLLHGIARHPQQKHCSVLVRSPLQEVMLGYYTQSRCSVLQAGSSNGFDLKSCSGPAPVLQELQAIDSAALRALCSQPRPRRFECRRPPRVLLALEHLGSCAVNLAASCLALGCVLGQVLRTAA